MWFLSSIHLPTPPTGQAQPMTIRSMRRPTVSNLGASYKNVVLGPNSQLRQPTYVPRSSTGLGSRALSNATTGCVAQTTRTQGLFQCDEMNQQRTRLIFRRTHTHGSTCCTTVPAAGRFTVCLAVILFQHVLQHPASSQHPRSSVNQYSGPHSNVGRYSISYCKSLGLTDWMPVSCGWTQHRSTLFVVRIQFPLSDIVYTVDEESKKK